MKKPKLTPHEEKYKRLQEAVEALKGGEAARENVEELIYASAAALRQGDALTTDEINKILISLPTRLDLIEEYPGE